MNNNDIIKERELAWNKKMVNSNPWSIPLKKSEIDQAKNGEFNIKLTPKKYIPRNWFPKDLKNKKILCLSSGGCKQSPLLAATGAIVTIFHINHNHLRQNEKVAKENNIMLSTVQGNMTHLEFFKDDYFDLIFCPVSVAYIPDIVPVFKECYRVLKSEGTFLFGSINPLINLLDNNQILEHSHTLENLIGGQTSLGFVIEGFYEDNDTNNICNHIPKYFATKSTKKAVQ